MLCYVIYCNACGLYVDIRYMCSRTVVCYHSSFVMIIVSGNVGQTMFCYSCWC